MYDGLLCVVYTDLDVIRIVDLHEFKCIPTHAHMCTNSCSTLTYDGLLCVVYIDLH